MGGEYYFAAQQGVQRGLYGGTSDIRIAYLPAYYVDCGAVAELCDYPLVPECGGHTGDSEFIMIDVSYDSDTRHWVVDAIFLSAHCSGGTSDDCNWQNLANFEWRDGKDRGAPVIWVSESKKGNYYSEGDCDAGGGPGWPINSDTCAFSNRVMVFPVVYGQQNIGSRTTPLRDCGGPFSGSPMTYTGATACMWSSSSSGRFNGWQADQAGDPPMMYTDVLTTYARF